MLFAFLLTLLTLLGIIVITFSGNFHLDVSNVKVEDIDIVEVFSHNFNLMFFSVLIGPITAGLYPLCELLVNIISLGMLSNSLYINNKGFLIMHLIPHGIIELFSLSCCVIYSFFTFAYLIKSVKELFLKKLVIKNFALKISTSFGMVLIMNTILLIVAAILEYII